MPHFIKLNEDLGIAHVCDALLSEENITNQKLSSLRFAGPCVASLAGFRLWEWPGLEGLAGEVGRWQGPGSTRLGPLGSAGLWLGAGVVGVGG